MFSKKFLRGRLRHLQNKLEHTKKALKKVGLPSQHKEYKLSVHIPDIEAAIARIHKGDYGYCADCSEEILHERLEKMPHAQRCVECQSHLETKKPYADLA